MYLEQFRYLIAVEETGSLKSASNLLFVTEQALSKAIKKLEEELGCQILLRSPKGVTFTREGLFVLEQAHVIDAATNVISDKFAVEDRNVFEGEISIEAEPYIAERTLSDLVLHYCEKLPSVILNVLTGSTYQIFDDVKDGAVDVGLITFQQEDHNWKQVIPKDLNYVEVDSCRMYISLSPMSPLAKQSQLGVSDLANYPLVLLGSSMTMHNSLVEALKKYPQHRILFASDSKTFQKMVVDNFGWAFSPYNDSAKELEKAGSVVLKPFYPSTTTHTGIIFRADTQKQNQIQHFVTLYKKYYKTILA